MLTAERISDHEAVARFRREMKAVGRLDHPNIVQPTDAGEVGGVHFLVMEFVKGVSLSNLLACRGPLPVPAACEVVRQAAIGLQHVHEHQLVHRDLKPSNLMLTPTGVIKVLDLGLARLADESSDSADLTGIGRVVGTADYMAPEQAFGTQPIDIRADIYSLGCTLYDLLAGHPPFSGPETRGVLEKLHAHAYNPAPPIRECRPEVPEALLLVLDRLLAKSPADRFGTPAEAAAALEPFIVGSELVNLLGQTESDE